MSYTLNIKKYILFGCVAASLTTQCAFASGGGGATFVEGVNYLPIKPALVVNYGGAGKVKYIKAEMSLRVEDAHAAAEVSHHMPLIRDTLIMFISSMTNEQMSSGDGKEQMREEALVRINEALAIQLGEAHPAEDDKKAAHGKEDAHAKDDHGKKDEHAKDDHGKKDDHAKDEHAKDDHGKKADKGKSEGHSEMLISDLLFDNLVVQK